MDISFGTMFSQMLGIFMLLVIGFALKRYWLISEDGDVIMSQLITKLFLPALMFYTFLEECTVANLKEYGSWMLLGALFQMVSIGIAILFSKLLAKGDENLEGIYKYCLAFPNTGGVGNPIILSLFGHLGLFQYQIFMLFNIIACYCWGVQQLIPSQYRYPMKEAWKNLISPVNIAMVVGGILGLTGIGDLLPDAIHTTLQNLGNGYSIVAVILVGFVIGKYHLYKLVREKRTYLLTLLRLILIPCGFMLMLRFFELPPMLLTLVCLTYACPCGMNAVVYPVSYGEDAHAGASLILITSVLSVFTIPLLFAIM